MDLTKVPVPEIFVVLQQVLSQPGFLDGAGFEICLEPEPENQKPANVF